MSEKFSDMLVVSDIDGTLLQAGYGIPKENIEAIDSFIEAGGLFTVATGRSVESVSKYVEWLRFSAPAILCNGGLIYDFKTRRILYERTLDSSVIGIVDELMNSFDEIGIEVHKGGKICAVKMNEAVLQHTAVEHISFTLTDISNVTGEWNKILIADTPENIAKIKKFVEKRQKTDSVYKRFDFIQTSATYYEIIPVGVNKGEGLKKLAEIMKIDMKKTVAIGDFDNDIPMLEAAGYAAAVADASPIVRSRADVTVRSCLQGGVAELLESMNTLHDGYIQMRLDI